MKAISELLTDEQKIFLLKNYVKVGVKTSTLIIKSIELFMKHLIVVSGLDPETTYKDRFSKELNQALKGLHQRSYDDDFDWVSFKLKETRDKLNKPELTKEEFLAATDISNLSKPKSEVITTSVVAKDDIEVVGPLKLNNENESQLPKEFSEIMHNAENYSGYNDFTSGNTSSDEKRIRSILDTMVVLGYCEADPIACEAQLKQMSKWTNESLDAIERVLSIKVIK